MGNLFNMNRWIRLLRSKVWIDNVVITCILFQAINCRKMLILYFILFWEDKKTDSLPRTNSLRGKWHLYLDKIHINKSVFRATAPAPHDTHCNECINHTRVCYSYIGTTLWQASQSSLTRNLHNTHYYNLLYCLCNILCLLTSNLFKAWLHFRNSQDQIKLSILHFFTQLYALLNTLISKNIQFPCS